MKTGRLIATLIIVISITLVSGSSIFANKANTINDPSKEQVTSLNEDEKESLQQEEANQETKVIENELLNTTNVEVDNSKKEPTSDSEAKKAGSRAIITSTWGSSPVTFDNITGVLTIGAGELVASPTGAYVDNLNIISKNKIKKIVLEAGVFAPVNSHYLFAANLSSGFTNLESIEGLLDTSKVTSMEAMFYKTSSLMSLDVSQWDTSQVNNMSALFTGTTNLVNLDVSQWDTSRVTSMYGLFYLASSLTNLDVSQWDTSKVTNMQGLFEEAISLTSIDVSQWDTSKVTNMYGMFYRDSKLTSIDISGWDTSRVNIMHNMFNGASNLRRLNLSSWDTSQVTNMTSMFSNTNLHELILGEKSIFNTTVDLPSIDTTSGEYTGRWERVNPILPESIYDSSNIFMSNYDGSMTGTYVWQRTSYTITYELNGGINNPSNPVSYAHGVGIDSFSDPTKDGYIFLGWVDAINNPVTSIPATETGNKVLYATWQILPPLPSEVYTITYELDGGTNALGNPTHYTCGIGVDSFADATKDGYIFLGWKDANNNSITSISDTDIGNKTLYAKWKKNPDKPGNSGGTNIHGKNTNTLPQTGEHSSVSAMILLLAGSLITSRYLMRRRKK